MKKPGLLYISDVNPSEPIFHSQVVSHILELEKYFKVNLIVLTREKTTELGYNYPSKRGDFSVLISKLIFLINKSKLKRHLVKINFDIIYSRGIRGGLLGVHIRNTFFDEIPLINDIRGDILDEHKGNFFKKNVLHNSNKFVSGFSNLNFFVSSFLKEKYCKLYGLKQKSNYVFPTFVPDNKFDFEYLNKIKIRESLNLSLKDIVVVYSGNLAVWQNVELILKAFSQTSNVYLRLLFLTKDSSIFELVNKIGIKEDRIKVMSVDYTNIHEYYHSADYGILIRDNTDTNKCASPTKFSEYVNSGLHLIINRIDADYVKLFEKFSLKGVLLEDKEDLLECFNKLKNENIERNFVKINTLSEIVDKQRVLIESMTKVI